MIDLIDLTESLEGMVGDVRYIFFYNGEVFVYWQVAFAPRDEVVYNGDFVSFVQKSFGEVGTEKSGTTGDKDVHKR